MVQIFKLIILFDNGTKMNVMTQIIIKNAKLTMRADF